MTKRERTEQLERMGLNMLQILAVAGRIPQAQFFMSRTDLVRLILQAEGY